jgi:hypothetical protein
MVAGVGQIGRITPGGVVTGFPVPTVNGSLGGITAGPDGNLWFTEFQESRLGRITPSGAITEFPLPTPGSGPLHITSGPDGNLWFTELFGNRVGTLVIELVTNGGFETRLEPWVSSGFGPVDGVACDTSLDGSCALAIHGQRAGTGNGKLSARQVIGGQPAGIFTFRASSMADRARTNVRAKYRALVKFRRQAGGALVRTLEFNRGTHGWQTLSTPPFAAPDTNRIVVEIDYFDQAGIARFDGVSLLVAP